MRLITKMGSWWSARKKAAALELQREPDPKVTGTLQGIGFGLLWILILFAEGIARSLGG